MQKRFDELKSTGQLPSPTGVAMKILRLAQQEDVNLEELVRVIKGDPAMAGRLLQLSNSACYASDRSITAVSEAVARLGLNVVWQAALGFSVISSHRRGSCKHFKYNEFWANSLAIAVCAQTLSRSMTLGNPEEAFACGLLSQVGRLALACLYPEAYDRLLIAATGKAGQAIVDLEQQAFAMDHRELTAAMLTDWGIAAGWVQAIRDHEDPEQTELPKNHENLRLARILHVAAQMGNMYVSDPEACRSIMQHLPEKAESLGVSREQITSLCNVSAREWNNWGKVLGIQTQTLPSFSILVQESPQTAHDIHDMKSALAAGADEYLRKPLNPSMLESRMNVAPRVVRLKQELLSEQEQIRQNLAQLAVLNRTLERDALIDPLTGLPNRRYAMTRLNQEWASAIRSLSPLCCLHLDLDHFKAVNDTHGHEAGDYVLAETALVLRNGLRASDVVCRIGGEEFLIICRDTNVARAMICAERIRQSIEEHRYCYSGMQIRITISIGIAERTSAMTESEELVKHADQATYESKSAGMNRFTVACF